MTDLRQAVYEALDAALPGRAHFLAPPVDAVEPCLSFFEVENAEAVFATTRRRFARSGTRWTSGRGRRARSRRSRSARTRP